MKSKITFVILALMLGIGIGIGVVATNLLRSSDHDMESMGNAESNEPLYWVAPMDSNYRRDKSGRSPMGMDLVPVYAENSDSHMSVGAIKVAAHVQNNMGVRLGDVKTGQLSNTLSTLARIEIAEDQMHVVSPRIEGWLEKLHVNTTSQNIVKGQPLFEIYSPMLVTAQEEFLTAMRAKNPLLIDSVRKRLMALGVSDALLQRLEKTGRVEQTVLFSAKRSGVVTSINQREGSFVTPGTPVMNVSSLDTVWLVSEVFEGNVQGLEPGNPVAVRMVDGSTIDTQVDFIYPILDAKTQTLKIRSILTNADGRLKPNMFAEAEIQLLAEAPVLLVPTEALIRLGDQDRVVLALDSTSFKSVAVEIGRVGDDFAEVKHGLRDGDRVVTSAQFLIDSESSKTSDFARMDLMPDAIFHGMHNAVDQGLNEDMSPDGASWSVAVRPTEFIWVQAKVKSINAALGTLTLTHAAIPEWNRPSMTMPMNAGPTIDLNTVIVGEDYEIQFSASLGAPTGFVVEQIVRRLTIQGESS
ncbi:MAG: Cu(I)/Ag(I) efflux system membrane fusion protein [Candidatus Azotimanducaceae bacterium]|jgi:Cu(I)/Ag(I) efflux system membrane fusion protein